MFEAKERDVNIGGAILVEKVPVHLGEQDEKIDKGEETC